MIYLPRTQLTSIFEGQPFKTRPFPSKTRVNWVPGTYYDDNFGAMKSFISLPQQPKMGIARPYDWGKQPKKTSYLCCFTGT